MTRKTKQDWLEAGFAILGKSGVSGLTIDQLTKRLRVTKGSFYHHFKNYQDYKKHLLAFWEQENTLDVVDRAEAGKSMADKLERFLVSLNELSPLPEIAIRAWALQDKEVRSYVERIDRFRITQAQYWFQAQAANDEQAFMMARLFHTILVGSYTVLPPILGESLKELIRGFMQLCEANKKLYD